MRCHVRCAVSAVRGGNEANRQMRNAQILIRNFDIGYFMVFLSDDAFGFSAQCSHRETISRGVARCRDRGERGMH